MNHRIDTENVDLELLMNIATAKASAVSDGHFTIMKFTTCWKVCFFIPNLDTGDGRKEVKDLPSFKSLKEALIDILTNEKEKVKDDDKKQIHR